MLRQVCDRPLKQRKIKHTIILRKMTNNKFEYSRGDGILTPFETFLQYSDEKEQTSDKLAELINSSPVSEWSLLDVGAGDGSFTGLYLSKVDSMPQTINVVEPSLDLADKLQPTLGALTDLPLLAIFNDSFQNYDTDRKFDIIVASHVPFTGDNMQELPDVYKKLLSLLSEDGRLLLVQRADDDTHAFREKFKTLLTGTRYDSFLMNDAMAILNRISRYTRERMTIDCTNSELLFPENNPADRTTLIEFLLNIQWGQIPGHIQQQIDDYISAKANRFTQHDGILTYKK